MADYKQPKKEPISLPAESVQSGDEYANEMQMSIGNITKGKFPATKTTGVKQRGSGAATKGFTSRGPLA